MMPPLVLTARQFHQRPSTLLAIEDPLVALSFDLAAAVVLSRLDREALERGE
jgi:hypothetical protein